MCPTSPRAFVAPSTRRPPTTAEPPTPVPRNMQKRSEAPRPAPNRHSARVAARASFRTTAGIPSSSSDTRDARGTSLQPRFGACTTVPVRASTCAATATPATFGRNSPAFSRSARTHRETLRMTPPGPSFAWRCRPLCRTIVPSAATSALTTFVAPRSMPSATPSSKPDPGARELLGPPVRLLSGIDPLGHGRPKHLYSENHAP